MKRVKARRFSGDVCEQYLFNIRENTDLKKAKPQKPRFESDEERQAFNLEVSRRRFMRMVNASFSPASIYSTLTYDAENEVHTVEECKRERDNFYRRILRAYPTAKVVLVYGRGKHTKRFHLHAITDGVPADELGKLWGRGSVIDVEHLRSHNFYKDEKTGKKIDHGRDYSALASYLFGHWQTEFGGHRWKASRNVKEPEPETPTVAMRDYDENHPPIAPKGFFLVETRKTKYGFIYFKFVRLPEPEKKKTPGRHFEAS